MCSILTDQQDLFDVSEDWNREQYYKQVTGRVLEAFYKPFNNEQVQEHINYSVSQFHLF